MKIPSYSVSSVLFHFPVNLANHIRIDIFKAKKSERNIFNQYFNSFNRLYLMEQIELCQYNKVKHIMGRIYSGKAIQNTKHILEKRSID